MRHSSRGITRSIPSGTRTTSKLQLDIIFQSNDDDEVRVLRDQVAALRAREASNRERGGRGRGGRGRGRGRGGSFAAPD